MLKLPQERQLAPTILIGQACLQLRQQARRETPARYNRLLEVAAHLQAIVFHLERFLEVR